MLLVLLLASLGLATSNGLIHVRTEGRSESNSTLGSSIPDSPTEGGSGYVVVRNCKELRSAVSSGMYKIRIGGDITCSRQDWGTPVVTRKNLEVTGETEVEGDRVPVINWTDLRGAIVAENGAMVFFQSLRMRQVAMGIGGLDLPFIKTRNGAVGVFAGVVVGVDSCPLPVSLYNDLSSELPRPKFLSGRQRTSVMDEDSLLVEDIALWWPNIGSLWQICNTVFICGGQQPNSVVNKLLEANIPSASCDLQESDEQYLSYEGPDQKQNYEPRTMKGILLASIGAVVAVVTLSAVLAVAYLLAIRHRCKKSDLENGTQNGAVERKSTVPILRSSSAGEEMM